MILLPWQRQPLLKPADSLYGCLFIIFLMVALHALAVQAGNPASRQPSPNDSPEGAVLARVNSAPITEQMVLRRLQAVHGDVDVFRRDPGRWQRMREAAIEAEIRDRLLLQAAIAEKLKVSEREVQDALEQSRRLLGDERYRTMLKQRNATEVDYGVFLQERLLIDRYKAKLFKDIPVDEQTLRAYYDGHRELFTQPRRAELEMTRVKDSRAASELLESLKSADYSKTHTGPDDVRDIAAGNANRHWVVIEDLPISLRTQLKTARAGDVLEPVEKHDHILVVRVLAVEEAHPLSFNDVRKGLQSTLLRRRQESLLEDWYTQAIQHTVIEYPPLP